MINYAPYIRIYPHSLTIWHFFFFQLFPSGVLSADFPSPVGPIFCILLHCWSPATLYTFPFTLSGTRLSQITPDILLHPFHPACTLFFTSLPHSPLHGTVEHRYMKSSIFATSSCIFTAPSTYLSFTHTCTMLYLIQNVLYSSLYLIDIVL